VIRGRLEVGARVRALVDPARLETQKHHTATHLLHAALRSVLGTHVAQAGSLVAPDRLRFDFSHRRALSGEETERIETLVNRWIQADFPVSWRTVRLEEARERGAMMLFGEKYGKEVRMVTIGREPAAEPAVSVELCAGTHAVRTGQIGAFMMTAEEAVSAGVRRVEARVGMAALEYLRDLRETVTGLAGELGAKPPELGARVARLQADLKAAQRESAQLRDKLAAAQASAGERQELREAGGFRYLASQFAGLDSSSLRTAADNLLRQSGAEIVVVGSDGLLVVKASQEARQRGAHAGNLARLRQRGRASGHGSGRPEGP
jgi:alanyl-tRNA synthetase